MGLTQPTVLTLEWIRGFFLVSASASVVNLILTIPQSIPSGPFSLKIQITCNITVGPFIRGKIRRVVRRVLNKTQTVPFIRACLI